VTKPLTIKNAGEYLRRYNNQYVAKKVSKNDFLKIADRAINLVVQPPLTLTPVRSMATNGAGDYKYVCITTNQPETKSNPNPLLNSTQ